MKYVVKAVWDETKWTVEELNHKSDRIIGPMIEGEEVEWLQLENIDDGMGNMVPTLTVDEVKKAEVLQQRLQDEIANNDEQAIKEQIKQEKQQKLKLFKNKKNRTLNDLLNGLDDIIDYTKHRDGF